MNVAPAIGLAISAIALLVAVVLYRRERAWLGDVRREMRRLPDVARIEMPEETEEDRLAAAIIERYRQSVRWQLGRTRLRLGALYELNYALVSEIAAVYHPDSARPELEATVADLLALNRRIAARVEELLDTFPFRSLRTVRLTTVVRYKERYEDVRRHRWFQTLQRHRRLYQISSHLWALYNLNSPFYWGRRVLFTASQEALLRKLVVSVISVTGDEALRVYRCRPLAAVEPSKTSSANV